MSLNTTIQKNTIDMSEPSSITIMVPRGDGTNDVAIYPRIRSQKGGQSNVPRAEIPIAYSKILVATSAIASNVPNGHTYSTNKIKARLYYELWKTSFSNPEMNGANTLDFATQQMIGTGTGAWRVFPKEIIVDKTIKGKKTKKVIYDDVYREPLDMNRTWFGLSYNPKSYDGRPEVLFEIDVTNDDFEKMKKKYKKRAVKQPDSKGETNGVSQEGLNEDLNKDSTHTTLTFYENPKDNRYIFASDSIVFHDGEMPNDDVYGSVVICHCFHKNMNSPYGVGLWEMIRGNQTIQNYIESLNTEQIAAEIVPIIYATGNLQGDMEVSRSSTKVNVFPAGVTVNKITTTGNPTLGENYIERKKNENDDITGVNNIVAGSSSETTLGATVILKEAALNRLMKPRNSVKRALEIDACIHFSWIDQDHASPRNLIFSSEEEVESFKQANPSIFVEVEEPEEELSEGTVPDYNVLYSPKVSLNFDYNKADLEETGYEGQSISELGQSALVAPRTKIMEDVKLMEDPKAIGYDKVTLIIDSNSMLIPSAEIEKQTAMQLFPIVQSTLAQIFAMSKQDPEQAKAQLKAFEKFMDIQRQNVYDWIPKESYDAIKQGGMAPTPEMMMQQQQMMAGGQGDPNGMAAMGPTGSADLGRTPGMNERPGVGQSPMGQAFLGGIGNMQKKNVLN
jgi:hypothetical protein